MFEDSFIRDRRDPGRRRTGVLVALGVSFIVHLAFVYGLYHARFPIKILKTGASVQEIVIGPGLAPPPPKIVGPPRSGALSKGVPPEPGRIRPAPAGERAAVKPPPEPFPAQPAAPPEQAATQAAGSAVPSLSAKFKEALASRFRSDRESDLTITLSPPGTKPGPAMPAAKGRLRNFRDYLQGSYDGTGGGYGTGAAGRGGGGTGGGQRVGLSIPLKGYDLTPWAKKVLEAVVANWRLPALAVLPEKSGVRIILIIAKSGELASLEVVEGTVLDVLDQAAVDAIRTSLPLPALPADFPGDFLEAHVEFSYHD